MVEFEFLKLELYHVCDGNLMWKKIYVEIEYLKLDFLCSPSPFFSFVLLGSSSVESFLLRAWVLLCVLPWVVFFLQFLQIFIVFFLFLCGLFFFLCGFFSSSSISLESQIFIVFFKFIFFFYGTRVPCGKNISMFAIRTRGFEARFLHWTRASKAWDVILENSFQFLLTNDIVWQTHSTLQITSLLRVHHIASLWSWKLPSSLSCVFCCFKLSLEDQFTKAIL